jgi:hypothetical protein
MKGGDMENLKPDLTQTMEKYGVDTSDLKRRGAGRGKILCPFHADSHPSLVVYLDQNSWYCYVCAVGGDVYDFVGRLKFGANWSPREKSMFKEVIGELDAGNITKIAVKPSWPPAPTTLPSWGKSAGRYANTWSTSASSRSIPSSGSG